MLHVIQMLQQVHASMLKILSDPILNHTIGSSTKLNKLLQLHFRISCFHDFVTQLKQNNQNFLLMPPKQNVGVAL